MCLFGHLYFIICYIKIACVFKEKGSHENWCTVEGDIHPVDVLVHQSKLGFLF